MNYDHSIHRPSLGKLWEFLFATKMIRCEKGFSSGYNLNKKKTPFSHEEKMHYPMQIMGKPGDGLSYFDWKKIPRTTNVGKCQITSFTISKLLVRKSQRRKSHGLFSSGKEMFLKKRDHPVVDGDTMTTLRHLLTVKQEESIEQNQYKEINDSVQAPLTRIRDESFVPIS